MIYIFLKFLARTWLRRSIRTVDDRPAAPRYSTSWLPSRARSCRSEAGRRNRRNNAKPEIWSIPRDRRSNILDPSLPRKDPRLDPRLTNRTIPSLAASCWNCSPPVLPPRDSLKIDEVYRSMKNFEISLFIDSLEMTHFFRNDSPRASDPELPSSNVTDRHGTNSVNNTTQPFVTGNCTSRILLNSSCNHVPLSTHPRRHPLEIYISNTRPLTGYHFFIERNALFFNSKGRKEERKKGIKEREREKKKKMNWWILKNGSRSKPRLERLDRVTTSIPRFQGEGRGIKKGGRRRRRRESRRSWFTNRGRTSVGDPTRVGSLTTRRISKFRYLGGPIASPGSKEPGSVTLYSGRASIAFVTPITHSLLFEPNSFTVRDFNILFLLIVTFLIALD